MPGDWEWCVQYKAADVIGDFPGDTIAGFIRHHADCENRVHCRTGWILRLRLRLRSGLMKPIYSIIAAAAASIAGLIKLAVGDDGFIWVDPDAASEIPRITAKLVEQLAYAGGSENEIADRFGVDVQTLRREYGHVIRVGHALHKLTLRGCQFDVARKLNSPMLIFLGKNSLGQSNNPSAPGQPMPETTDDQDEA